MKDATGELSMTAVAVVAIAAIAAVFTMVIWPQIRTTITRNSKCSEAYNCNDNGDGTADCQYLDENGAPQPITCSTSN